MFFNIKEFVAFTRHALFPGRGSPARLTPGRAVKLAGFYAVYLPLEVATHISFPLDDLLYRSYRDQNIDRPVFIIGNPRSGTTFLQRLLAQDQANFSCMNLWEILFAPSILQRRILQALVAVGRKAGVPLRGLTRKLRALWKEDNDAHLSGLLLPEEDQYLFFHTWSTLATWQFGGILTDRARDYTRFDTDIPEPLRELIMTFYRRAIQRHLYAHRERGPKHYLSKNPSATPKIASLHKHFPDGRFIYLVRNPLDMLPSMISTVDYSWEVLGDPPERYTCRDHIVRMARHWYTYPLEQLAKMPEDQYAIVRFNDMVGDPDKTVREIYDRLGLTVNAEFARILEEATEASRNYKSNHDYSLSGVGLSGPEVIAEFRDIFERFDFDTRGIPLEPSRSRLAEEDREEETAGKGAVGRRAVRPVRAQGVRRQRRKAW